MTDAVITERVIEIRWTEQLETNYVRRVTETELRRLLGDKGAEDVIGGNPHRLREHIDRAGGAEAVGGRSGFTADAEGSAGWGLAFVPVVNWVGADEVLEKPEPGHGTLH